MGKGLFILMAVPDKFQKWLVDFGGPTVLAGKLGVSTYVVNHWKRGDGWPRISIILEIVRLAKGKLSIEDVIESTYPKHRRRKG